MLPDSQFLGSVCAGHCTDKALSRYTQQYGNAKRVEKPNASEDGKIMLDGLAESDARISEHEPPSHSRCFGRLDPRFEEIVNLEQHISVGGIVLHRARVTFGMHQHHGATQRGRNPERIFIMGESGNVVDEPCPAVNGGPHDACLARIDGNRRRETVKPFQNRTDTTQLLIVADRLCTRPGGLATDVDERRAFRDKPSGMSNSHLRVTEIPAVGKTVRRDIDNPHEPRPAQ